MVTSFPGYNVSPVSEAWNRPGLRGEGGGGILKLPHGYNSLYNNVNAM